MNPALAELAEAYGIAPSYRGNDGIDHPLDEQTAIAALQGFGVRLRDATEAAAALRRWREDVTARPLPACTTIVAGQSALLRIGEARGEVRVVTEDGGDLMLERSTAGEFEIPAILPIGYHHLEFTAATGTTSTAPLIVVPQRLDPPVSLGDRRTWGFAVQLYSVTSSGSWGIGDLEDLAALAEWSAGLGAGYVLTNPLHAAEPTTPISDSPYSPSSRRFLNPIYIRPESIAGYAELPHDVRLRVDALRSDLPTATLGDSLIDRDAVWAAKLTALRLIYDNRPDAHDASTATFRDANGPDLRLFAAWSALVGVRGRDIAAWPAGLRDGDETAVSQFATRHSDLVEFQIWLQWILAEQFAGAQHRAVAAGMPVGIVNDLAVGVGAAGAEVWADPTGFADGITVGAPPDAYNRLGQGWGLAAWRPDRLAAAGYRPFIELVRALLRSCGGVRIDHIMGLFRLWWIPADADPRHGAYVRYDHVAMVGILMLEARRAGALIVGEDLGTVEAWVRDYLAERGILGTSVLWFERTDSGAPLPPERYRSNCMASVTTHDLAPTAGYLTGAHLTVRDRLGLLSQPLDAERLELAADLDRWRDVLRARGLLGGDKGEVDYAEEGEILALHRYLCATPARVVCAALTDATGDRRMQNQPGTFDEYPNWRLPLTDYAGVRVQLEDLRRSATARRLAAVLTAGLG